MSCKDSLIDKHEKLTKKSTHKCEDYCGICSPLHALQVLLHKLIIEQKKRKIKRIK